MAISPGRFRHVHPDVLLHGAVHAMSVVAHQGGESPAMYCTVRARSRETILGISLRARAVRKSTQANRRRIRRPLFSRSFARSYSCLTPWFKTIDRWIAEVPHALEGWPGFGRDLANSLASSDTSGNSPRWTNLICGHTFTPLVEARKAIVVHTGIVRLHAST